MPIDPIVLQRRHAELGRIRLGEKVPVGTDGKSRPGKLDTFRFTSPAEDLIRAVAAQYGGEARPWRNGTLDEWEVITPAKAIPVIAVKGGLSQWMESWSGGGCVHRCDGIKNVLTDEYCRDDDPAHVNAKPTTRLSVMLPDIETLGVWRLESHGYNAAAELPWVAELAAAVGEMVPAVLRLAERKKLDKGKTSRFVVPVLDLQVTKARLMEIASGMARGATEIGPATAAPQIEAPPASPLPLYVDRIAACTTVDEVSTLWREIVDAGHLFDDVRLALMARGTELAADAPPVADVAAAEPAYDPDAEAAAEVAWAAVVAAAGKKGMTSTAVVDEFEQWSGLPVGDGDAAMFDRFRAEVLS